MCGSAAWRGRGIAAFILVLTGVYYLWAAQASGTKFEWGYDLDGYYDFLGRAFTGGHLYLPVDESATWHDMARYRGHYYLYFGAAPAVLLFAPWRLATGHDLPENFALLLLCYGGFLFSAGALLRVLRLAEARPGPVLRAFLLLALGFCQSVPYLLNRAAVYEIAIGGGYFCLSGGMFFLVRAVRSRAAAAWLALAGLMFGLAVGSRPHLALCAAVAAAGVWVMAKRRREVACFALALALTGVAIGIYNYQRFGNPLEFGFFYQVAGPGQNRVELAPRNLVPGLYYMLLSRPDLGPVFPWMRMAFRFPFDSAVRHPLPPEYFIEPTVGALWIAPFLVAAVFVPGAKRLAPDVRAVLWVAAGSALAALLFLMAAHLATHRYEVDFLPMAVWAAAANIGIRARGRWLPAAAVALIAYSTVANLALGMAGPYDDILKNEPSRYVRIAGWFSPIAEYRPAIDPAIRVELEAWFAAASPGYQEPVVTTGHSAHQHFLYVRHEAGLLRFVSRSGESAMTYDLPDPGAAPVRIALAYAPDRHIMTLMVNGREAIAHPIGMLVAAPAQVAIGENFSDYGLTTRRFAGRIRVLEKSVRAGGR